MSDYTSPPQPATSRLLTCCLSNLVSGAPVSNKAVDGVVVVVVEIVVLVDNQALTWSKSVEIGRLTPGYIGGNFRPLRYVTTLTGNNNTNNNNISSQGETRIRGAAT